MTDDLISRRKAIDALMDAMNDVGVLDAEDINTVFQMLPPAQPKRGKWIKISPANIYECSECGKHVMTNDICAYDFCHVCGADMRGVAE